jgi:cytoplasmic iron level regulating protein YaaA (DUF328/UPF0246 family)
VLVLLPPSEGKTAPLTGPPLDIGALSSPRLGPLREKVLDALVEVSARPDAATLLGVGPGVAGEVARNTSLLSAPTARAAQVYSGVLYVAAELETLPPAARARADNSVRIVSGLWGLVSPGDPIPAYRLSMGTDLPGIGPLAPAWRGELGAVLDGRADGELVVDCRSATYLAVVAPAPHRRVGAGPRAARASRGLVGRLAPRQARTRRADQAPADPARAHAGRRGWPGSCRERAHRSRMGRRRARTARAGSGVLSLVVR